MADLDDFFAKKDRKRTKAKKFATSDELAKKLEDTTKKSEPKTRDKTQLTSLQSTQSDGVEIESGEQLNAAPEVWIEFFFLLPEFVFFRFFYFFPQIGFRMCCYQIMTLTKMSHFICFTDFLLSFVRVCV